MPGAVDAQQRGIAAIASAIESGSAAKIRVACASANLERAELIVDELRSRGTFL